MSDETREKAEDALYERIAEKATRSTSPEGLKTLSEAYANVRYGPQGWRGETDYRSEAENWNRNENETDYHTTAHEGERRGAPAGFTGPEGDDPSGGTRE